MRSSPHSPHVAVRPRWAAAWIAAAAIAGAGAAPLQAQNLARFEPVPARANDFPLTLESIMRGPEHIGQAPAGVNWSDDGEWIYFRWLPGGGEWHDTPSLHRVRATGGTPERIDDETELELGPVLAFGDVSPDGRWRATSFDGDLYLIERATAAARRLTHTEAGETGPVFSGDGASIFFRRGNNLLAFDIDDGEIRQLTSIGGPEPAEEPEAEGHRAFLEEQQRELFEHIRVREIREERAEARRELRESGRRETLHLAQGENAQGFVADPTGSRVAVTVSRGGFDGDGRRTDIPLWVTESGYTENTEMRAKVGDEQSVSRLADRPARVRAKTTWLDLTGDGSDTGPGVRVGVGGRRVGGRRRRSSRRRELRRLGRGGIAYGLVFAVDYDYKTWRLYAYASASGELDPARHACTTRRGWAAPASAPSGAGCMGWLPSEASGSMPRAWYVSEETGYAHLYAIDADGGEQGSAHGG